MVMTSGAALAPLPLAALQELLGSYGPALSLLALVPAACMVLSATFKPTPFSATELVHA